MVCVFSELVEESGDDEVRALSRDARETLADGLLRANFCRSAKEGGKEDPNVVRRVSGMPSCLPV